MVRSRLNTLAGLLSAFWLTGCASMPDAAWMPPAAAIPESAEVSASRPASRILIGTVPGYRRVDAADSASFYEIYLKLAPEVRPDSAAMLSLEEFRLTIAGWTRLKVSTVPLRRGVYEEDVLVPARLAGEIGLPTVAGSFAAQEAGDLLVARTNADGFFIVQAVLCRDGRDYRACAAAYEKGVFDGSSGIEIEPSGRVRSMGRKIDTNTYKLLEKPDANCVSANIQDSLRATRWIEVAVAADVYPDGEAGPELELGCNPTPFKLWASR